MECVDTTESRTIIRFVCLWLLLLWDLFRSSILKLESIYLIIVNKLITKKILKIGCVMYKLYMNPNSCYKDNGVQNGYPITFAYDYARSLFSSCICMEYLLMRFQMVNSASGTNFYAILYILWRCSFHYLGVVL